MGIAFGNEHQQGKLFGDVGFDSKDEDLTSVFEAAGARPCCDVLNLFGIGLLLDHEITKTTQTINIFEN